MNFCIFGKKKSVLRIHLLLVLFILKNCNSIRIIRIKILIFWHQKIKIKRFYLFFSLRMSSCPTDFVRSCVCYHRKKTVYWVHQSRRRVTWICVFLYFGEKQFSWIKNSFKLTDSIVIPIFFVIIYSFRKQEVCKLSFLNSVSCIFLCLSVHILLLFTREHFFESLRKSSMFLAPPSTSRRNDSNAQKNRSSHRHIDRKSYKHANITTNISFRELELELA